MLKKPCCSATTVDLRIYMRKHPSVRKGDRGFSRPAQLGSPQKTPRLGSGESAMRSRARSIAWPSCYPPAPITMTTASISPLKQALAQTPVRTTAEALAVLSALQEALPASDGIG